MNMQRKAAEIAFQLVGTCKTIAEIADEDLENNKEFCEALDDIAFCCELCNWWYSIAKLTKIDERWLCEECANENDNDD
jgi:hypothetical protein